MRFVIRKFLTFISSPMWKKVILFKKLRVAAMSKLYYKNIFKKYGKKSLIYSPLLISHPEFIEIGNMVHIRDGLRIEAITEWEQTKFSPSITIEDFVSMEQNCHITCGNRIIIGRNTTILFNVTITDIDHSYEIIDKNILKQPINVSQVNIGENCFIGAGSKIFGGTTLGRHCIVGANSVVRGTFPCASVIAGSPARIIKQFNFQTHKWEKVHSQDAVSSRGDETI